MIKYAVTRGPGTLIDYGQCEPQSLAAILLIHYPREDGYELTF